jgi:arginyl-tRNA synthetase
LNKIIKEKKMHVFARLQAAVKNIIAEAIQNGNLPEAARSIEITVEPPREAEHGDAACNAAMVLAKTAGKSPRLIAEFLLQQLKKLPDINSVEIAGPGFINIRLNNSVWQEELLRISEQKNSYGNSAIGKGETIHIEYVSANPTGPMHVGHARGAVVGDALAALLAKAGYKVVKEYYINDAGGQIDTLARSCFLRYREALGDEIGAIPAGLYPGSYLIPVGKKLVEIFGQNLKNLPEAEYLQKIKPIATAEMMLLIKKDLQDMGIFHDVFTSEAALHSAGAIEKTISALQEKALVYRGVLEPPKGKTPDDWEPREQTLFKTTEFGDDVDRPLQKSDGSWTYFAADIAYHWHKLERGFSRMVLILGADHGGYVGRMKAAVSAMSSGKASIEMKLCQIVNFLENGVPLKMSKRAGTFATVRDVMDEVGAEVLRFIMLTRKNDVVLDFDLQKVKEQSRDNPVFYVQYAYARSCSVLRHAEKEMPDAFQSAKIPDKKLLANLDTQEELALLRVMAVWPRIVEASARSFEPHRIAFYLQELAASFHALWNRGKDDASLRFILSENSEKTAARLALLQSLCYVIASGLSIMAVKPLEEM